MYMMVPSVLLPLLLLVVLLPVATPSTLSPGPADDHTSGDVYIVFVSRADYLDTAEYDVRLLASVIGSTEEARTAMIYHYGGLGFAARLESGQADRLSKMGGVAVFKDNTYHVERDDGWPRFFEENI